MVAGGRGSGRSGAHAAAPAAAASSSQQQQQRAASSRKQRAVLACIVESTGRACSGGGKAAQLVPPWVAYLLQLYLHYSTAGTGVQALHRGREWDMEVISVHVHALVRFLRYRAA